VKAGLRGHQFVAEAFGEELVHEDIFQLGGGLNDPLLRFERPLHRRKDVRDLLLFGEGGRGMRQSPRMLLLSRCRLVLPSIFPARSDRTSGCSR